MDDEQAEREARHYVAALRGFYIHLFIFIAVMATLLAVNVMTAPPWWVQWPAIGWGIGVIGHAIAVFRPVSVLGSEWQERKVRERLAQKRTAAQRSP